LEAGRKWVRYDEGWQRKGRMQDGEGKAEGRMDRIRQKALWKGEGRRPGGKGEGRRSG